MRKKAYREVVDDQRSRLLKMERKLQTVTCERDDLRRHLQRIRIAHDPLREAISPPSVIRAPDGE